jgi:hypothetical protein
MTTTDPVWEMQKAVYTALSGDATLTAMISGVFSHVPQDTAFPYIKFDNIIAKDWSTKSNLGIQATLPIHIFSRGRGDKEALNIAAEVKRVLDDAGLSMTGCTMVSLKFSDVKVSELSDGVTWQAVTGFRAMVQVG